MYPLVKRDFAPKTRGSIRIEIDKCIFCGICQRKCPTQAIVVTKETKHWDIDRFRCIICNACVEACPKKCLFTEGQYSASAAVKSEEKHNA
jgi:formate hydrogenlyase subunit 6/NADH:ubiquinone oxidoreductase subunit I